MISNDWRKSSYSQGGANNCVEVRGATSSAVQVRDSKHPDTLRLSFDHGAWVSFLHELKHE